MEIFQKKYTFCDDSINSKEEYDFFNIPEYDCFDDGFDEEIFKGISYKKELIEIPNIEFEQTADISTKYSKKTIEKLRILILMILFQNFNKLNTKKKIIKKGKYIKKDQSIKIKPGRKTKNNNNLNVVHSKDKRDNIVRKIKIRTIKFANTLINDCIKFEFKRQTHIIRNIDSQITSNITIKFNNEFFNLTMEEILTKYSISNEYTRVGPDENKKQVKKLREKKKIAPLTNELLDKTFKEFFYMFRDSDINDLNIYHLKKAETLNQYLSSLQNESEEYKKDLKNIANTFFDFFNIQNARKSKFQL